MATYTQNMRLIKPDYEEKADKATINNNMDIVDETVGGAEMGTMATTLRGAIAEHEQDIADIWEAIGEAQSGETVEGQIGGINQEILRLKGDTGYIVDGDKSAVGIQTGCYVELINSGINLRPDGLYRAKKAIPANVSIDNTYLESVTAGGLNDLLGRIPDIVNEILQNN